MHRLLAREGLLDRRPGEPTATDRRRFAFRDAGEPVDERHHARPQGSVDGRRRRKTFLIAFLDDATRVIAFAAFAFAENTTAFLPVFKNALIRRGLPLRLYVDNGANYRSQQLALVCVPSSASRSSMPAPTSPPGRRIRRSHAGGSNCLDAPRRTARSAARGLRVRLELGLGLEAACAAPGAAR